MMKPKNARLFKGLAAPQACLRCLAAMTAIALGASAPGSAPSASQPASAPARPVASSTTSAPAEPLLDLPPVSLSTNKATLRELVEALNTSLGRPGAIYLAVPETVNNDSPMFTLEARQVPFWELFQTILGSSVLEVRPERGGRMPILASAVDTRIRYLQVNGPIAFCPTTISLAMAGGAGTPAQQQKRPQYTARLLAMIDPRLAIAAPSGIKVLKAVDNRNQELKIQPGTAGGAARSNVCTSVVTWSPGKNEAAEVTLTCEVRFTVQLSDATVTVEDPQPGAMMQLASHRVVLSRLNISNSSILIQVEAADDASKGVPYTYLLRDAKGNTILDSTKIASVLTPAIVGITQKPTTPLTLVVTGPDRTGEIVRPFVVNIPLP